MKKEEPRQEGSDSLEAILADYDKKEENLFKKKEKQQRKKKIRRKLKKFILMVEIVVLVTAAVRLTFVVSEVRRRRENLKYLAVGKRRVSDPETEKCIARMWQMRKAAGSYYRANKKFPQSMEDLYGSGFLEGKMVCPATGREYFMEDRMGGKTFRCPNPEEHRVKEIWCYVTGGVPVLERQKLGK